MARSAVKPAASQFFTPLVGEASSVPSFFHALGRSLSESCVFREKTAGAWEDANWSEFLHRAAAVSAALSSEGLVKSEVGCIFAATSMDWMVLDMGLMGHGMVAAGIYPTEPVERIRYILGDCAARVIFVDSADRLASVKAAVSEMTSDLVKRIVCLGFEPDTGDDRIVSFVSWIGPFRNEPIDTLVEGPSPSRGDAAILIYTSGTTGPPKGAEISHGAILWQIETCARFYYTQPGWIRPAFLPLCHVAERYFTYYGMAGGAISCFVPDPADLYDAIREIKPHFMVSVPRIYEKLCETARDAQHADLSEIGLGRIKRLYSGGAPPPSHVCEWFAEHGTPILEMYGMTETGTITSQFPSAPAPETVGRSCGSAEFALRSSGEVAVKGKGLFTRYLNKPEATAAAFDGDWFLTGDLGSIDKAGNLSLVGRLKDIIITSVGKNVAPIDIERKLCESALIEYAILVGEGRKYITALIVVDRIGAVGEGFETANGEFQPAGPLLSAIQAHIDEVNGGLSQIERIKRFAILPNGIDASSEMTPTMKVKRAAVVRNHIHLIEEMYG